MIKWYHVSNRAAIAELNPTVTYPITVALLIRSTNGSTGHLYIAKMMDAKDVVPFLTLGAEEADGYWSVVKKVAYGLPIGGIRTEEFTTLCKDVGLDISDIDD